MNYDALRPGFMLRDLPLTGGSGPMLSELRGARSMILFFGAAVDVGALAGEAAERRAYFDENETQLVWLARDATPETSFSVFRDDGGIAAALARQNGGRDPRWLVLATDRFGEIFFAANGSAGDPLPAAGELERWALHLFTHCPECHPPEWPPL